MSDEHREQILEAIRQLAAENGGRSPGRRQFESNTAFRESDWFGRYWARWSDALEEAGCGKNVFNGKRDEEILFQRLREVVDGQGRFPTYPELRIYARNNPGFPSDKTFSNRFRARGGAKRAYVEWAQRTDIPIPFDTEGLEESLVVPIKTTSKSDGWVYLVKSGAFFKIGRSDQVERRLKEISITLPESVNLVHAISTDDPAGIEAYWHRRFANKRAKGEWFALDNADVKAFRRRKYQ